MSEQRHRWHHRTIEDHRHELGKRAAVAIRRQADDDRTDKTRRDEVTNLARRTRNIGPTGAIGDA